VTITYEMVHDTRVIPLDGCGLRNILTTARAEEKAAGK